MVKMVLDLSNTLKPLENELKDTMNLLCPQSIQTQDCLLEAIENFSNKYGKSSFNSIDELLNASLSEAHYMSSINTMSFEDSLEALLSS